MNDFSEKVEWKNDIILHLREEHGVRYEEMKEFAQSLFRTVYYEAFVNTKKLMDINRDYKIPHLWKHDRIYNIIPFWGARGMGKTSVMHSFLGALDCFKEDEYKKFKIAYEEHNGNNQLPDAEEFSSCEFVCLECIDASLLDEKEDIFEVVLAKMLGEFLKKISCFSNNKEWVISRQSGYFRYRKEDIVSKFEKIYRDLQNLKEADRRRGTGIGAVEILRDLSGSLDLRETFKELVPLYLKIMGKQEDEFYEKRRFLVISIDDLDLKLHGYEILEQIHRYFMVPDVLIYITVAEAELIEMCNRHFQVDGIKDASVREQREKLVKAYIDKVLPFSNRVYMPMLFSGTDSIKIAIDNVSVKKTILWKIARRTKVYFDGCGMKQHFYEATDVRTLVNLWGLLGKMQVLDKKMLPLTYQSNMEYLIDDISNRLAVQKLSGEQRQEFSAVSMMNVERRGIAFLQRIVKLLGKGKFTEDFEKYGYSYGELLRGLYTFGREHREEKPFVQCVLALETVALTNLFEMSQITQSDVTKKSFRERLLGCFCDSVSGSWGNKMVPKVTLTVSTEENNYRWGYMKGRLTEKQNWSIRYSQKMKASNLEDESRKKICDLLLEDETVKLVETLELLSLFSTKWQNMKGEARYCLDFSVKNIEDEEIKDLEQSVDDGSFRVGSDKVVDKIMELKIGFNQARVTFDIFGFVVNCIHYDEVFDRVEKDLLELFKKKLSADETRVSEMRKCIQKSSMRNEFRQWEEEYGYMALPAHSTDMIYNVFKRAKRKNERENPYTIADSSMLTYLGKAYTNVSEILKEEDEFYNISGSEQSSKSCCTMFEKIFKECPLVKKVLKHGYGNQFEDAFNNFVKDIMINEELLEREETIDE